MDLQRCMKEFHFDDGYGLYSLYILNTNLSDWEKLLGFLYKEEHQPIFRLVDIVTLLPSTAMSVFTDMTDSSTFLAIKVDNLEIHCFFLCEDEIELVVDPIEVKKEADLQSLFEFMRQLGQLLTKDVVYTPGNSPNWVIFQYIFTQDTIIYHPTEHILVASGLANLY